ncbi:hypothetical protein NDU88_008111 [Pleurodeles waltl]|uniref:Uncharacterized protein n=1 Tax=Pleurodeles waltl TaxID=8319 RepID=A0AAV7QTM4_PLEWA|nr:hypothetical protein NDU88_008111 [Pleurodeles waltl]
MQQPSGLAELLSTKKAHLPECLTEGVAKLVILGERGSRITWERGAWFIRDGHWVQTWQRWVEAIAVLETLCRETGVLPSEDSDGVANVLWFLSAKAAGEEKLAPEGGYG